MKQPDRFAQVVRNAVRGQGTTNSRWYLYPEDAEKLLRRQHRAIVRLVKRELKDERYLNECNETVKQATCEYILAALARYRKGKR